MDSKGRAIDNVFTERLWRIIKYEEVYLNEYDTPRQARERIREWFAQSCENEREVSSWRTPLSIPLKFRGSISQRNILIF